MTAVDTSGAKAGCPIPTNLSTDLIIKTKVFLKLWLPSGGPARSGDNLTVTRAAAVRVRQLLGDIKDASNCFQDKIVHILEVLQS